MLDVVTAALSKDGEGDADPAKTGEVDASATEQTTEDDQSAKSKEEKEVFSSEEIKRLNKHTQERIRELVAAKNKSAAKIAELKPRAEQYEVITRQIRETGLTQNDLAVGFDIMTALKRGDLFGARSLLEPIFTQVMQATGGVLPKDLADEVNSGAIAQERARELAVARAAAQQAAMQGRVARQQSEFRQAQQFTANVVQSVNAWEQEKAARDPDWKLKVSEVRKELELSLLKGVRPKSTAEAVSMAEKALKDVEGRLKAYRPAPKPVNPGPRGNGASSRNLSEPKTMLDVVNAALG